MTTQQERIRAALEALNKIDGCFEAAIIEGLLEQLSSTEDLSLRDLVERRLMWARTHVAEAIAATSSIEPAQSAQQANERERFEAFFKSKWRVNAGERTGNNYFSDKWDCAWQGWQAALAAAQQKPQAPEGYTDDWISTQWQRTLFLCAETDKLDKALRIFGNRVLMQFGDSEGMHRAFSEAYERDKAQQKPQAVAVPDKGAISEAFHENAKEDTFRDTAEKICAAEYFHDGADWAIAVMRQSMRTPPTAAQEPSLQGAVK